MRTHARWIAAALVLAALPRPAAAQPDALRERFAARLEDTGGATGPAPYRRMWEVLDSVVLRELARGADAEAVNRTLAAFPGFAEAGPGVTFSTEWATYTNQLPRDLPGYVVVPLRASRRPLLLGVYNFGVNGAGRVSLFTRRAGRWVRTATVDARSAVAPYVLPLADSALALVTLDRFTGGDHVDGTVQVWRVRDGAPTLLRTLGPELKEPSAEAEDSVVRIQFNRFPRHLGAPILGTRIEHVTTIAPAGATVTLRDRIANPWVEVVDRYYGLVRQSPAQARALLAAPSLARQLGTRVPESLRDGGRPEVGGWVVLRLKGREKMVSSTRGADGRWRIVSIQPGEGVPCDHVEEPPPAPASQRPPAP